MDTDNRDELVLQVDAARAAGDTAEVERLEAEVKRLRLKFGRRKVDGTLDMDMPPFEYVVGGTLQSFDQWNRKSG